MHPQSLYVQTVLQVVKALLHRIPGPKKKEISLFDWPITIMLLEQQHLSAAIPMEQHRRGCTTWLETYGNGRIAGMTIVVRPVCFVVVAGTSVLSAVGRLLAPTPLASAWSSSRSQLAAHSGFAFEREGSYKIMVNGSEGRSAVRHDFP